MARGTKNPDHVRLSVLYLAPCAVSAVLGSMRQFHDSAFAARLAGRRKVWVFSPQPYYHSGIFEFSSGIVSRLYRRVLPMEGAALLLRRLTGTFLRTISAIAIRWNDIEMLSADPAVSSSPRDISLLIPSQSADARLTSIRAVALVRAFCSEATSAATTEQIVRFHGANIT